MSVRYKIAVNCRFLIDGKLEGIGTYTHEVLQRLVKLMPECEFHFLFDREPSSSFFYADNIKFHVLSPQARHPFLWWWWFEISAKNWLNKNKCDVFLSPDSFLSLASTTPTLLIMHDIAFEHFDDHNNFLVRKYYRYFFSKYAKKASKILAVSEFTKQDIVNTYQISPEKIEIAYCGISDKYKPISETEKSKQQQKISNGNPYFISIGSINPRKNLDKVIEAFSLFKHQTNLPHQLVIVGAKGWKSGKFYKAFNHSTFKNEIILTGHLQPDILNSLLASAEALVFPSLFEGFGIPILEAFKAETPVITANVSSMPEVANDAAILVNPDDVQEICSAMIKILDENTAELLVNEGKERANHFSWQKTTEIVRNNLFELVK